MWFVFLTGVGFRYLMEAIDQRVDRQRFSDTLSDIPTIARGPKPVAAMKEVGLTPTWVAPEPNTWRELLTTIDRQMSIANQVVAIQEYGKPKHEFDGWIRSSWCSSRFGAGLPLGIARRSRSSQEQHQGGRRIAAGCGDVHLGPTTRTFAASGRPTCDSLMTSNAAT